MVPSGLSHAHHRPLSCSFSAMTLLLIGRGCALSWPRRRPGSAIDEARTCRSDDAHWPSSAFMSAVHGVTMGRQCSASGKSGQLHISAVVMLGIGRRVPHCRPSPWPALAATMLMIGPSDAIHRPSRSSLGSRSRPVPTEPLSACAWALPIPWTERGFPGIDVGPSSSLLKVARSTRLTQ